MTAPPVYRQGWKLDDVHWDAFEPELVDPTMLAAIKAAALVEYNAPDYVTYLKRVFRDAGARDPGRHRALGRRGKPARPRAWPLGGDGRPSFKLEEAFARFRKGYTPAHFADQETDGSVRGSRRGEMIARCVVESGTSSYYSAIRDATEEPVLKEIAGRIAADEFRHYKLFYDTLHKQDEPEMPLLAKAVGGDRPGAGIRR